VPHTRVPHLQPLDSFLPSMHQSNMKVCNVAIPVLIIVLGSIGSEASQSSLKVIENFLSSDEINEFKQIEASEKGTYDNRRHGRALAKTHFVRRLQEVGAVSLEQDSAEIKTSVLTQTSKPHIDVVYPDEGGMRKVGSDDNVVFIFLNDNPDAKFVFGDEIVPVVAGNMVTFNGHQVQHNTVVENGEVHLLGPFESRRLQWVGSDGTSCGSAVTCPSGGAFGDPHFRTWHGEKFDFHGQCDLELVSDPDFLEKGLRVTIRTKIVRNWSYIDTAAIRIGNDILEVQGGDADVRKHWVNGEYQGELSAIGGFPVSYTKPHSKGHSYTIDLGDDHKIEVRTYKEFVRVDFQHPTMYLYGNTVGLLGHYGSGLMLARDGTTVIEDPIQFGREWQVRPDEPVLFHEVSGPQLPHQQCVMPEELVASEKRIRRRLGQAEVTESMAERACDRAGVAKEDLDACVFDVLAADDIEMAGAY